MVLLVVDCLTKDWKERFGLDIRIRHLFSCESVGYKRNFILAHFKPECMFAEMKEVAEGSGRDVLSGETRPVPPAQASMRHHDPLAPDFGPLLKSG